MPTPGAYSGNTGSGSYGLRLRLSTTAPLSGGYGGSTNVVASFSHSLGAFSQGTFDLGFTVPAWLPNGVYFIYLDMDPARTVGEFREGDNSTVSAMRINVNC
jgi:hypothetical protein